MGIYVVLLPTALWLQQDDFTMRMHGIDIHIHHHTEEQPHLDPRLGGFSGHVGFERDPLGILRYSVLTFELDEDVERRLLAAILGNRLRTWKLSPRNRRVELATAICNAFLDQFRSFRRNYWIERFDYSPLAHLDYRDERETDRIRLYGGAITLPPAGIAEDALDDFKVLLVAGQDPPRWRLAVLDAMRTAQRGLTAPALIAVLGALETELNAFFAAAWRAAGTTTNDAANELALATHRRIKTIEDVLRIGDLRQKIEAYATSQALDPNWERALNLAVDARNDAVHGGIALPKHSALRHVQAIGNFLEEQRVVLAGVVAPARPRILHAFEEATGSPVPQSLERVVEQYLIPHGLDAIVYNDSPSRPKGPVVDEYGRTIVIWLPLHDRMMTPDRLALVLARMAIAFSLRYQGEAPLAKVGDLPFDDWGGGYSAVAWELTRAVWEIGIDRVLETEGMGSAITSDINSRADAIRNRFGPTYAVPPPMTASRFVEHAELARVATVISRNRRERLLDRVAVVALDVAERSRRCIDTLTDVNLLNNQAVRDALICLHDQSPMLLASVVVLEPETGQLFGNGLVP